MPAATNENELKHKRKRHAMKLFSDHQLICKVYAYSQICVYFAYV